MVDRDNSRTIDDVAGWIAQTCIEVPSQDPRQGFLSGAARFLTKAVVANANNENGLWPNGQTVTYCFKAGDYQGTPIQQNKVVDVVKEWAKYANVSFIKVDDQAATIRITFNPTLGAWSRLGTYAYKTKLDEATMNIGPITTDPECSPMERGYILHEFGHALGLFHEHQSPLMANQWREDAILRYYKMATDWSDAKIRQQILNPYTKENVGNYSQLDMMSIMMYPTPPQMFTPAFRLQHQEADDAFHFTTINTELTSLDKAYMVINYPRPEPHPDAPEWTLAYALDVAGVDSQTKERLLDLRARKNITELRTTFNRWNSLMQNAKRSSALPGLGMQSVLNSPTDTSSKNNATFFRSKL